MSRGWLGDAATHHGTVENGVSSWYTIFFLSMATPGNRPVTVALVPRCEGESGGEAFLLRLESCLCWWRVA